MLAPATVLTYLAALAASDIHLVLQGCHVSGDSNDTGSDFWTAMSAALQEAIPFTSVTCPPNMAAEQHAVDAIVQRYVHLESMADVIIVSALVQPAHCHGDAQAPAPPGTGVLVSARPANS